LFSRRLVRGAARAFRDEPHDAALDIALDEVLLDRAEPAARVWTPRGRAVVIGIASRAVAEVRLDECRASGVPVRRRFSGGAPVLLSPEVVCFALVFPYVEYEGAATIGGAYRLATLLAAEALGELGLKAEFEPPADLAVSGHKIVGFAQARRRRAALVHGVLPVSLDGAELDRLLGRPADEPAYRRGRAHSEFVTDLRRELGSCDVAEVEAALAKALAGEDAAEEEFTPEEIEKACSLAEEKYLKDEWSLRR
jgi:lipoate-protein ligase A